MDDLQQLKAQVFALSIVTERAWANIFANFTADPVAECRQAAKDSIAAHDEMLALLADSMDGNVGDYGHEFMQTILHHEEEIWKSIETRVGQILERRQD